MPVGGLSILFEVLGASSCWSRRQRVIGRSAVLPETIFSASIFEKIAFALDRVRGNVAVDDTSTAHLSFNRSGITRYNSNVLLAVVMGTDALEWLV